MQTSLQTELVFFEKRMMKERNYDQEKKQWIPTGKETEMTVYTFIDDMGEKLVLFGGNEYRDFKGKHVNLLLDFGQKEFQGQYRAFLKIAGVTEV